MKTMHHPPIFQSVPADEFTDREEIIGMLVERATNTPRDMTLSASIVGQRRLGKTAVLEQVYNRLFWEQTQVVPTYFNLEAQPIISTDWTLDRVNVGQVGNLPRRNLPNCATFLVLQDFAWRVILTCSKGTCRPRIWD